MKANVPTPAIIAVVAVVVVGLGFFLLKGVGGESTAPKPDPTRFLPKGVSPVQNP